jgi:hypothetical protein
VAHAKLCELVAPATPATIEWTTARADTTPGRQRWGFIWSMFLVAVAALVAFVVTLYEEASANRRALSTAPQSDVATAYSSLLATAHIGDVEVDPGSTDPHLRALLDKRLEEAEKRARATMDAIKRVEGMTVGPSNTGTELFRNTMVTLDKVASNAKGVPGEDTKAREERIGRVAGALADLRDVEDEWKLVNAISSRQVAVWPDYLLLVFAGTLGAAFYNLYYAHQHIVNRTFCAAYVQRYLIRLVLGAVSGLVLGHFGGDIIEQYTKSAGGPTVTFSRAFLALLGGYTVEAVNLMFTRVADAMSTLFRGSFSEVVHAKEAEIKAKAEKANTDLRMALSRQVEQLRPMLSGNGSSKLDEILRLLQE